MGVCKHILAVACADCNEVVAWLRVVIVGQANRAATLVVGWHALFLYLLLCAMKPCPGAKCYAGVPRAIMPRICCLNNEHGLA